METPFDTFPMDGMASPLDFAISERDRSVLTMVRDAIDRRDVLLAFQPVMRADNPGVIAFQEGLVRVLDDTGRVIPARDFISVVETQELGRKLDCLSLEIGVNTLRDIPDLRLAVNMSARSIGYPRWVQTLRSALDSDPNIGERLILEITEGSAMLMPDLVTVFMDDLQKDGITFALDDFGAGFTSFRYLRDFFFDILKIDGQFIHGIHDNPDNQVLTHALISIARQFDMFTVAEAVETAEDAAFLTEAGIDCMQGYFFGAPTTRPVWLQEDSRRLA